MADNSFDSEALSGESIEDEGLTKTQTDDERGKNKNDEEENDKSNNNLDLIKSISSILETLMNENEKLENYKDIIKNQSKSVFSSNHIPNISIEDYLIRIQNYSCIEKSTLILSLILIDHICKKSDLILTYFNVHRILFGSVLISIKSNEDLYYDNKFYSEIAGVKLKELKSIELTFLELSNFNVFVKEAEYEQYKQYLEDFDKNSDEEKEE